MTYITGGAIIALIILINAIIAYGKTNDKKNKKIILGIIVGIIFFLGTSIIDSGIILISYTGLYELPQITGYLSEVSINDKSGAPSSIIFNGKEYNTSKEILVGKKFLSDTKYIIHYSPLTKIVISIKEYDK